MPQVSHGPRTLELYRRAGFFIQKVEQWVAYPEAYRAKVRAAGGHAAPGIRRDLFGIADAVAKGRFARSVYVQWCAQSGVSAHKAKAEAATFGSLGPEGEGETSVLSVVLRTEEFHIVGWKKEGARWRPRIFSAHFVRTGVPVSWEELSLERREPGSLNDFA